MNDVSSTHVAAGGTRAPAARAPVGPVTCIAFVVGTMIGSGVFLLPATLAPYGPLALLGWICAGAGAMSVAYVLARLVGRLPRAGGPYAHARAGLGDLMGFMVGWGHWISNWTGNAAIAVAMASYLQVLVPAARSPAGSAVAALAAIWVLTGINMLGIAQAGRTQVVLTIAKLVPLLGIGLLGLLWIEPGDLARTADAAPLGIGALATVTALTLWAFVGLECATVPAQHVRDAARAIPRATLLGTALVTLIYLLCTVGVMAVVPAGELARSNAPFADAARVMLGGWAYYAVALGAVVSCLGTMNGCILMQGQIPAAAARDGVFPPFFGRLSRRGMPVAGLALSSTLISVLLLFKYSQTQELGRIFEFTILLATLATLIPYAACAVSLIVQTLAGRRAGEPGALRVPVLVASGAILFALWAIYGTGIETVLYGLALLLAGLPVYAWSRAQLRRRGEDSR